MPREKKQIYGIYVNGAIVQPDCIVTIGEKKWNGKVLAETPDREFYFCRLDRAIKKDVCVSKHQVRKIEVKHTKEDLKLT